MRTWLNRVVGTLKSLNLYNSKNIRVRHLPHVTRPNVRPLKIEFGGELKFILEVVGLYKRFLCVIVTEKQFEIPVFGTFLQNAPIYPAIYEMISW